MGWSHQQSVPGGFSRQRPAHQANTQHWEEDAAHEEAGHRGEGWLAPQTTQERGKPGLCSDSSSGH